MSTQAMPQIPPRPARSQEQQQTLGSEIPKIPPRPNKRIDRSQSPNGDRYARSPLNEPNFMPPSKANHGSSGLYKSTSANASTSSFVLPSIGQEGNEYESTEDLSATLLGSSPSQTRNVANDLKLHAPKPSLPANAAKARVSTVTRTDSDQAAAFGIGKPRGDDKEPQARSLKSKTSSLSMTSTNGTERPTSSTEDEHGIPIHGQRVPMYPNAGDVQAPSPSPYSAQFPVGIGFHNDGTKPRHHGRRTSARGFDAPPGAYGLHGHGVAHTDRFEQAYYQKHPELLKKEHPHYQEERGGWAMSSEDLNKIVRDTASRGAGLGASKEYVSTPTEQIGFMASEQYTSRVSSPRPATHKKASSVSSQTHADSPLKHEGFNAEGQSEFEHQVARGLKAPSETALESEVDDDDIVHVDAPGRRISKIYGGAGHLESTESLGHNYEDEDEHGYSAPILASDEVAKEPLGYELQPAVSPMNERRPSYQYDGEGLSLYRTRSGASSRNTSRPGSIHGGIQGLRHTSEYEGHHTPLEDLEEYEPLFPEDDSKKVQVKPISAVDKLKVRPDLKSRKFPSQDVWEDTPASLNYTTTVSAEQAPEDTEEGQFMRNLNIREGETASQAFARQQEEIAERESKDSESFLHREKKPQVWAKNKGLSEETRPSLAKQRFPSRDIWEDTADSLMLQTTVGGPQADETEILSPPDERPTTGAVVYHQEKAAAGIPLAADEGRATTGLAAVMGKPAIPARPTKAKPQVGSAATSPTEAREKPTIPISSKPVVPARPVKASTSQDPETAPLSKVTSAGSAKSIGSDTSAAAAAKPKPPVPSRPVGSKIAALQGGFMADLNKRIGLGPQAPKKEEVAEDEVEEKEKAPLADARKSRARGPARRAPAKSPTPASSLSNELSFSMPTTVWSVDPDLGLSVTEHGVELEPEVGRDTKATKDVTPTLATNTAGESLHAPDEISKGAATASSLPSATQDLHAEQAETTQKQALIESVDNDTVMPVKPSEDPIVQPTAHEETATEADSLSGSTATLKPVVSATEAPTNTSEKVLIDEPVAKVSAEEAGETVEKMPGGFEEEK